MRCGLIVWFTGVPGTGKTTLASKLLQDLQHANYASLWLDSDAMRPVLTPEADYSSADRDFFYAALGHLAGLGADGGAVVVLSATASRAHYRDSVRARYPNRFVEIYLTVPPENLAQRDIKGLYRKSQSGDLSNLPGQGSPFDVPAMAELSFDTSLASAEVLAAKVWAEVHQRLQALAR